MRSQNTEVKTALECSKLVTLLHASFLLGWFEKEGSALRVGKLSNGPLFKGEELSRRPAASQKTYGAAAFIDAPTLKIGAAKNKSPVGDVDLIRLGQ